MHSSRVRTAGLLTVSRSLADTFPQTRGRQSPRPGQRQTTPPDQRYAPPRPVDRILDTRL